MWSQTSCVLSGLPTNEQCRMYQMCEGVTLKHGGVVMWKCFPHYWPFVRGILHQTSCVLTGLSTNEQCGMYQMCQGVTLKHDGVVMWKCFLYYWPFVRGILYQISCMLTGLLTNEQCRIHQMFHCLTLKHEDVITWKLSLHYWSFVRAIPQLIVDSPLKGPITWGFPLVLAQRRYWTNYEVECDLRSYDAHVMLL